MLGLARERTATKIIAITDNAASKFEARHRDGLHWGGSSAGDENGTNIRHTILPPSKARVKRPRDERGSE
jgi:hypothetical protein